MDFEPQKFFVGLMDFFSILLPGALLTFFLKEEAIQTPYVADRISQLGEAKGWVAFLVISYVLGHVAFLLGSWLDELYEWLRRRTLNVQIKQLVRRKKPTRWWVRWLVWLVFKRERDQAVKQIGKIKETYLSPLQAKKTVNNFQWSKALLTIESPTSLAVIQRFEADSKFFRCFVIVLFVMLGLSWRWQNEKPAIAAAILLPLAMWRYMEQRFKATNQAYWSVITFTAQEGNITINKEPPLDPTLTHAGGVVYRKPWFRPARYLLVEASDNPDQWVLPKGKIEEDEDTQQTAVREVHEETGVWARIDGGLGRQSYSVNGKPITVQVFLMKRVARGVRSDPHRKSKWLTLEDAIKRASHAETRNALALAEQTRLRK